MSDIVHEERLLFFIPARGGSGGIHRKNLQEILGVTLVGRCVQTCFEALKLLNTKFGQVVVSTNDEEIARIGILHGAEIHWRPDELCEDSSTTEEALGHFLGLEPRFESNSTPENQRIAMLQCTSPFTRARELVEGFESLNRGYDSAFLGVENHYWLYSEGDDGSLRPQGHLLGHRPSRQAVKVQYHETGAAYFFRGSDFQASQFRLNGSMFCVSTDLFGSIDIDEPEDLVYARLVALSFDEMENPS